MSHARYKAELCQKSWKREAYSIIDVGFIQLSANKKPTRISATMILKKSSPADLMVVQWWQSSSQPSWRGSGILFDRWKSLQTSLRLLSLSTFLKNPSCSSRLSRLMPWGCRKSDWLESWWAPFLVTFNLIHVKSFGFWWISLLHRGLASYLPRAGAPLWMNAY